ncbi:MAG TPA: nitrous oxide reductase family maturation protein NosD [Chromatiales bacterium]|nr:nitrous oxide reductase family maturation protein NosD [Thiotrichales bacterium]HIP67061.1 nitrous oxide reductase family maturation protein NosD [Chromatiales bacterium]
MKLHFLPLMLFCFLSPLTVWATAEENPLQALIDAAEPNAVLTPEPGTYYGSITIDKPLTLDGQGKVTIDAKSKGSVIYLETDGAIIKNLHLTNSGESHNDIDAGVQVRGNFNVVKDNIIDNCLFGVDLQQSEHNIVRRNQISSKDFDLGQRGDSVRLWYSFNNKITHNIITKSRDMVVWYSRDNVLSHNTISNSRYSLHFMYSQYNEVEYNQYYNNTVGIFLMYSDGVVVRHNHIAHAAGPTGVGIGFKETSDLVIENNEVLYCATGFYIDVSPYQPDTTNRFSGNLLAYNGIGIRFLNDWQGNIFKGNNFTDNLTQVVVPGRGSANRNIWEGNFWGDYEGFDQDADGIGDKPYNLFAYADSIWSDVPYAQFFKGSPMLEALDFLERLAPFSDPLLLVRDKKPMISPVVLKNTTKAAKGISLEAAIGG